jgi:hypothetical protein
MSQHLRAVAVATILVVLRVALRLLTRWFPQSRSVVLAVFPETEGNGLEVARALLERYDGQVVWLTETTPTPAPVRDLAAGGLHLVPKWSLRGMLAYLRAEAVFFTHGLYGSPRPVPGKPVVNLWHGDGPKDVRPDNGVGGLIAGTYFVGSTRLFSRHQAAGFGVPEDRVLVTGNPRTDVFWRPSTTAPLSDLGITDDFVLWMPTFRRTRAVGAMRQVDEAGPEERAWQCRLEALLEGLRDRGLQLVVKPHPMDAEEHRWAGAVTVRDADLARTGVGLYDLLARSRGLVTDYSSVWVDYLLLDRPLAFLVPDRDSYTRRLVPEDVLDWVPGEVVGSEDPFGSFLADLDAGGRLGAAQRAQAAARMGLNESRSAADDLLTELQRRGVLDSARCSATAGRVARAGDGWRR